VDHEEQAGGQGTELNAKAPPPNWVRFVEATQALDRLMGDAVGQPSEDRLANLMFALDALAIAFQELDRPETGDGQAEAPSTREKRTEQIRRAFPELGQYWSVRPEWSEEPPELGVGDGLDDLADILCDVDEALWFAENIGWPEGMWEARFTWEHHTGAHLVDLRAHIYRLRWFGY
jgi:hypothetical protein